MTTPSALGAAPRRIGLPRRAPISDHASRRSRSWRRTWVAVGSSLLLAANAGCGAAAADATRAAAPVGIEKSLQTLNEKDNQELMRRVFSSPAFRDGARQVALGLVDGISDSFPADMRNTRIEQLTDEIVRTSMQGIGRGIREDVAPALAAATRLAIDQALAEAFTGKNADRLDAFAARVARAMGSGMVAGVAEATKTELAPATAQIIREQLGPAVRSFLRDEVAPGLQVALAPAVRGASKEVTLGVNDALVELQSRAENRRDGMSLLENMSRGAEHAFPWTAIGVIFSTMMLLAAGGLLYWRWNRREHRLENTEASWMVMLTEMMLTQQVSTWSDEQLGALEARIPDGARGASLRDAIRLERARRAQRAEVAPHAPTQPVDLAPFVPQRPSLPGDGRRASIH